MELVKAFEKESAERYKRVARQWVAENARVIQAAIAKREKMIEVDHIDSITVEALRCDGFHVYERPGLHQYQVSWHDHA